MKSRQVGYVLIVVIVLGVAGLLGRLLSLETKEPVLTGVPAINGDVIDKLVIWDREKMATLTKSEGVWLVGSHPVLDFMLEAIWASASELEGAELISNNPENHAYTGVIPQIGVTVQFWRGEQLVEQFYVGDKEYGPASIRPPSPWSSLARTCYVRRPEENEVYGIFCPRPNRFDPDPENWSDPTIVEIPLGDAELLTFTYPEGQFNLRVIQSAWMVETGGVTVPADADVAISLVRELEDLWSTEIPTEEEVAALNFEEPNASLRIETREGSDGGSVLLLFIEKEDGSYYVKDAVKPYVYLLSQNAAEKVLKTRGELTGGAAVAPAVGSTAGG